MAIWWVLKNNLAGFKGDILQKETSPSIIINICKVL